MTVYDDRRSWPGTRPAATGCPARRAGSVRRTINIDLTRPDGFAGPLVVAGAGRDLATHLDGSTVGLDSAETRLEIDTGAGKIIVAATAKPDTDVVASLVGQTAGSGFRRMLAQVMPEVVASGSVLHQLLDETTPAALISTSVAARLGTLDLSGVPVEFLPVDICAGWQSGGAMLDKIAETGVPMLGWGPDAPDLTLDDDPLSWHEMSDLPATSMRRRRLLDVASRDGEPGVVDVGVIFRDSYWEDDGSETVVHEYGVAASVETRSWTVAGASADPGPLPAPECPQAHASASGLVGERVEDLRDLVRDRFTGTSTCTHLNDVFRSLTDVRHLWLAAQEQR